MMPACVTVPRGVRAVQPRKGVAQRRAKQSPFGEGADTVKAENGAKRGELVSYRTRGLSCAGGNGLETGLPWLSKRSLSMFVGRGPY